jgi:hypothetical protein
MEDFSAPLDQGERAAISKLLCECADSLADPRLDRASDYTLHGVLLATLRVAAVDVVVGDRVEYINQASAAVTKHVEELAAESRSRALAAFQTDPAPFWQ